MIRDRAYAFSLADHMENFRARLEAAKVALQNDGVLRSKLSNLHAGAVMSTFSGFASVLDVKDTLPLIEDIHKVNWYGKDGDNNDDDDNHKTDYCNFTQANESGWLRQCKRNYPRDDAN